MKNILYGGYIFLETIIVFFEEIIWKAYKRHKAFVTLSIVKGYRFKFVPKGQVLEIINSRQHLPARRRFEHLVLNKFVDHIQKGDIVLDVGANMGVFSLVASELVGNSGKVYAIEASNNNALLLKRNLALNGATNVTVINIALSNSVSTAYLADPSGHGGDAMLSLSSSNSAGAEELTTNTWDNICTKYDISHISLIKVDIEGAELLFFQGAERFLRHCQPVIIMECYEGYLSKNNHCIFQLLEFLRKFDYTFIELEFTQWIAMPKNALIR